MEAYQVSISGVPRPDTRDLGIPSAMGTGQFGVWSRAESRTASCKAADLLVGTLPNTQLLLLMRTIAIFLCPIEMNPTLSIDGNDLHPAAC